MTSEPDARGHNPQRSTAVSGRPQPDSSECFVYITLPDQTAPVPAARFVNSTDSNGITTGRFRYARSYLERPDAVPFDPVELKLDDRTFRTTAMRGVFGALRDAGPDFWGRRVIERHVGKPTLTEIDYLLNSPDDRAGALGFGLARQPPAPLRAFNKTLHLARLQTLADALVNDEEIPPGATAEQVDELMLAGTSMGGARPKTVVEDDEGLWVAKFNRTDDRWNYARTEHAMLELASECSITAAKSKVVTVAGRDVLLVKRFDRHKTSTGYVRSRMVSGLTLLRAEDTEYGRGRWSYPALVEELRRVSAEPKTAAHELFRRMCFNAMISNTDDHPRNHAIVAKKHDWSLSPAYDLLPFPQVSIDYRELALICGDAGRFANRSNLVSQCARFLLTTDEALDIFNRMRDQVKARWYSTAREAGVVERDCERLSGAFLYDSLFYST